jgi:hypothetical protein
MTWSINITIKGKSTVQRGDNELYFHYDTFKVENVSESWDTREKSDLSTYI